MDVVDSVVALVAFVVIVDAIVVDAASLIEGVDDGCGDAVVEANVPDDDDDDEDVVVGTAVLLVAVGDVLVLSVSGLVAVATVVVTTTSS